MKELVSYAFRIGIGWAYFLGGPPIVLLSGAPLSLA